MKLKTKIDLYLIMSLVGEVNINNSYITKTQLPLFSI